MFNRRRGILTKNGMDKNNKTKYGMEKNNKRKSGRDKTRNQLRVAIECHKGVKVKVVKWC